MKLADHISCYITFHIRQRANTISETQKRNMEDFDAAIRQYLESIRLTPDDHPERAGRLESLGTGYHDRYRRTGKEADLDAAIQQYLGSVR